MKKTMAALLFLLLFVLATPQLRAQETTTVTATEAPAQETVAAAEQGISAHPSSQAPSIPMIPVGAGVAGLIIGYALRYFLRGKPREVQLEKALKDAKLEGTTEPDKAQIFVRRIRVLEKEKAELEQSMKKFLGGAASEAATRLGGSAVGGGQVDLSVVFADLRGYTSLSEKVNSATLLKMLNEYLTLSETVITRYQGHINKFIGDAVMAYFDPEPEGVGTRFNDAERAIAACSELLRAFKALRQRWGSLVPEDLPLGLGCGVATGKVFRGNIGTPTRVEYALIGDTVNLASRLCGQAGDGNTVVAADTYDKAKKLYDGIEWPPVKLKNKAEPQRVVLITTPRPGVQPVTPV